MAEFNQPESDKMLRIELSKQPKRVKRATQCGAKINQAGMMNRNVVTSGLSAALHSTASIDDRHFFLSQFIA
jgi:hypothetical protein